MKLPVTPDTIDSEVESAIKILTDIRGRLQAIPGEDMPASEPRFLEYTRELCGELMIAANKCNSLASVLADLTV